MFSENSAATMALGAGLVAKLLEWQPGTQWYLSFTGLTISTHQPLAQPGCRCNSLRRRTSLSPKPTTPGKSPLTAFAYTRLSLPVSVGEALNFL